MATKIKLMNKIYTFLTSLIQNIILLLRLRAYRDHLNSLTYISRHRKNVHPTIIGFQCCVFGLKL